MMYDLSYILQMQNQEKIRKEGCSMSGNRIEDRRKWFFESPIGMIGISAEGNMVTDVKFIDDPCEKREEEPAPYAVQQTKRWLKEYFTGSIPDFMPDIMIRGTPFQMEVYEILKTVPYGSTVTYGEIAAEIAERRKIRRMSAQAVGGALNRNPVWLIVPCHRVIGSDGSLVGYEGGLERKKYLLELERNHGGKGRTENG